MGALLHTERRQGHRLNGSVMLLFLSWPLEVSVGPAVQFRHREHTINMSSAPPVDQGNVEPKHLLSHDTFTVTVHGGFGR